MFVLMDIEWVDTSDHHVSPTQIATMRVDEQWNCVDRFFSRITPEDSSSVDWDHIAFSGGTPSDFLLSHGLFRVLTDLRAWLKEDDTICFWHNDSKNTLKSVYALVLNAEVSQRIVILSDYLFPFLIKRRMKTGNPYMLCNEYGVKTDRPTHHSENDVSAIQKALRYIQFPASLLNNVPPCRYDSVEALHTVWETDALRPYQLEVETGIFHKSGCSFIRNDALLTGHPNLKYFLRKKLTACPHCMKEDLRKGIRERNQDIICRTQYRYVYTDNSEVFHRRECSAILSTTGTIKGSIHFNTCLSTGRRPCRLCNPINESIRKPPSAKAAPSASGKKSIPTRTMNAEEQRSYNRFLQARGERFSTSKNCFKSDAERKDFYTLTHTGFAFFSAAGYQTFHRRNCRKLHGLSGITGFSRYKDALHTGRTPCKICKPTAKHDIQYPVPITSKKRRDESPSDIAALCSSHGYPYEIENQFFCFTTPVGKWKINISSSPYVVYHINLIRTPDNDRIYHRQPRLFLSLADTFSYIHHHDKQLQDRSCSE